MPIPTQILATIPALIGSLMIMSAADAGRGPIIQQSIVAVAAITATWIRLRRERSGDLPRRRTIVVLFATTLVALLMPLLSDDVVGPRRWIEIGGFRIYVAAVLLPTLSYFLADLIHRDRDPSALLVATGIAAILAAQPDAPQCTALAAALLAALGFSDRPPTQKSIFCAAMAACVGAAWRSPDALEPVPYVEGVFQVARSAGGAWMIGALVAALLPPAVLLRDAQRSRSPALLSTVIYYAAIGLFVAQELTPMPLLGFGAAPILGFFLLAGFAPGRRLRDGVQPSSTG